MPSRTHQSPKIHMTLYPSTNHLPDRGGSGGTTGTIGRLSGFSRDGFLIHLDDPTLQISMTTGSTAFMNSVC